MKAAAIVLALFVSFVPFASAHAEPIGYKEIHLGDWQSTYTRNPSFRCRGNLCVSTEDGRTFAGAPVKRVELEFYNGILHQIEVAYDERYSDAVHTAMTAKYGTPVHEWAARESWHGGAYWFVDVVRVVSNRGQSRAPRGSIADATVTWTSKELADIRSKGDLGDM